LEVANQAPPPANPRPRRGTSVNRYPLDSPGHRNCDYTLETVNHHMDHIGQHPLSNVDAGDFR